MTQQMGFGNWNGIIDISFISHENQRYDTSGDWELKNWVDDKKWEVRAEADGDQLIFRITDTGDLRMNFCLLIHELNEALVYLFKRNFSQEAAKAVDEFDMRYNTDEGNEPGFDPLCPCYAEHMYAMECEHGVAAQLMLDWNKYTETIGTLIWRPDKDDTSV